MFTSSHFPGKQKDEKVILILRRHWFVMLKFTFRFILIAAIPAAIYFIINNFYPQLINNKDSLSYALLFLAGSIYYLFVWLFFFASWLDYYLDVWIVSDERVIDVELRGLFSRTVSELKITKVQDVTSEIKGMIPTFLKYGNVYVQTAGEQGRFIFKQVPNPDFVKRKIIELHDQGTEKGMTDEFSKAFPKLAQHLKDESK